MKRKDLFEEDNKLEAMLSKSGWKDVSTAESKASFIAAAKAHLAQKKKEARVNIRVQGDDLTKLRELATREGVGYQTLLSSVIHKFAQGNLVDKAYVDLVASSLKKSVRI